MLQNMPVHRDSIPESRFSKDNVKNFFEAKPSARPFSAAMVAGFARRETACHRPWAEYLLRA